MNRSILAAISLLLAAAIAGLVWLVLVYPGRPGPGLGRVVEMELPAGISARQLAARLAEQGAITDARVWALYAFLNGAESKFRRGVVLLRDNMTARQVLRRVARGLGPVEVKVTIPEGYSRFEMARLFERWGLGSATDFLRATEDRTLLNELGIEAASAEGYLFPDTYRFDDQSGARALARKLTGTWRSRVPALLGRHAQQLAALRREFGWGVHQVLILASLIEKEAGVAEERPMIAGVFLNRLLRPEFLPKRLQADPSVAYGCLAAPERAPSCAGYDGKRVTSAMLSDPGNPYNTYRIDGLPPGPICNPGLEAIRAALIPARHDFFYFVAGGNGRHRFSATIDAHNQAVRTYRDSSPR